MDTSHHHSSSASSSGDHNGATMFLILGSSEGIHGNRREKSTGSLSAGRTDKVRQGSASSAWSSVSVQLESWRKRPRTRLRPCRVPGPTTSVKRSHIADDKVNQGTHNANKTTGTFAEKGRRKYGH